MSRAHLLPVALLLATGGLGVGPVEAAVIDFNGTTADDYLFADYSEDGYLITKETGSGHYDFFGPGLCNLNSGVCSDNFINVDDSGGYGPSTIRMAQVGGGGFDLFSLSVLDVYDYNQQTFQFSACGLNCQVRSSKGGVEALTAGLMEFSAQEWRGIDWIEFYTSSAGSPVRLASAAIDNIVVAPAAVPAPATLGLLSLGIGSLMARRAMTRRG